MVTEVDKENRQAGNPKVPRSKRGPGTPVTVPGLMDGPAITFNVPCGFVNTGKAALRYRPLATKPRGGEVHL